MNIALFGYTGSGKTSLCTLLSGRKVESFNPEEPAVTIVKILDPSLELCAKRAKARKTTFAEATLFDFKGSSKESGFQAKVLTKLLRFDLIIMTINLFSSDGKGSDLSSLFYELIFHDTERIETLLEKRASDLAHGRRHANPLEDSLLEKASAFLKEERPLSMLEFSPQEYLTLRQFGFVTLNHFLYIANGSDLPASLTADAEKFGIKGLVFNISEKPSPNLIDLFWKNFLDCAGYLTFYTIGEKEAKGWLLKKKKTALDAAEKIHTDIAKGFIRAEVIHYEDFISTPQQNHPEMHLEGKGYIVQNQDILSIRFSR
ncbi:MAG: DUF933 domain-containing protein [Candidatus Ratteibacteria bacterium]